MLWSMTLRKLSVIYAALFMLLLASVLISYRYLVSLPSLENTINQFHRRELQTLDQALNIELQFLKTINYDYAVWNDSLEFAHSAVNILDNGGQQRDVLDDNRDFVNENLINDTYTSLRIDGIYFYDLNNRMLFGKGYDYINRESLTFAALDLHRNPDFRLIYPEQSASADRVPQKSGFLNTAHGPVLFSATELRNSDRSGEPVGILVFVRKVPTGAYPFTAGHFPVATQIPGRGKSRQSGRYPQTGWPIAR